MLTLLLIRLLLQLDLLHAMSFSLPESCWALVISHLTMLDLSALQVESLIKNTRQYATESDFCTLARQA